MKFDMVSATEFPVVIPRSYIGRYRMNLIGYWKEYGEEKVDCLRNYFEVAEV
jgi:hypothetical protein